MKARHTPRAVSDLAEIADYVRARSAEGAANVRAEIQRAVALLQRFPLAGARTAVEPVRRLPVRRYPYIVYYVVDADQHEVVIITIQHGARRRPFEAT